MDLGAVLKTIREAQGLNERALNARSGVDRKTTRSFEKGNDGLMLSTVQRLAAAVDHQVVISGLRYSLEPHLAIRVLRLQWGYTLQEVQAICKIDQADLSRIENGIIDVRIRNLVRIAEVYDRQLLLVPEGASRMA